MIVCKDNIFILETRNTHYVLGLDKFGYNHHNHWGKKCDVEDYFIKEGRDEGLRELLVKNVDETHLKRFFQNFTDYSNSVIDKTYDALNKCFKYYAGRKHQIIEYNPLEDMATLLFL